MLFNSISFLLFFPIVCLATASAGGPGARNLWLLACSYYFYMNWEPAYALLLLTSTVVTYLAALGISHYREKAGRKACLVASLVLNLAIPVPVQVLQFPCVEHRGAAGSDGARHRPPRVRAAAARGHLLLHFPGFGVFDSVYRGTTQVERDFRDLCAVRLVLPQLVAGPIERSNNLLPQFKQQHRFDYDSAMSRSEAYGMGLFYEVGFSGPLRHICRCRLQQCQSARRIALSSFSDLLKLARIRDVISLRLPSS